MKRFIAMSSLALAFAAAFSCSAAADNGAISGADAVQAGDRYADSTAPPAIDESQPDGPDADNADEAGAQDETNDDSDGDDSDDPDDGGPEQ